MTGRLQRTIHEARGMLADLSLARTHPVSFEIPVDGASHITRAMHVTHRTILHLGDAANWGYERKVPVWPVFGEVIGVLSYGAEKIVYQVSHGDPGLDSVVSVYHRESIGRNAVRVASKKREAYETCCRYFGSQVVPTAFVSVDNPWGRGAKPATIQSFIRGSTRLSSLTPAALRLREQTDGGFAHSMNMFRLGYSRMRADNFIPDLSSGNVLVQGSNILLCDSEILRGVGAIGPALGIHTNYGLVERSAGELASLQFCGVWAL
jgi:hypothetical protein